MKKERRLLRVARCKYLLSLLTGLLSKWLKPDRDDRRKLESETSPPLSYPLCPFPNEDGPATQSNELTA